MRILPNARSPSWGRVSTRSAASFLSRWRCSTLPFLEGAHLLSRFLGAISSGLIGEGIKLGVLLWLVRGRIRHQYDGVFFALALGLGFATVAAMPDTWAFLADGDADGALLHVLVTLAVHAILAVVMGYLLARATLTDGRKARRWWLVAAWLVPALLYAWSILLVVVDLPPKTFCVYLGVMLCLLVLLVSYSRDADSEPPSAPRPASPPDRGREPPRGEPRDAEPSGTAAWFCRSCLAVTDHEQGRCLRCDSVAAPRFLA
jgi:PrsW family intramembrane metalloprotease